MKYEQYTETDFLEDEYFRKWVLKPDEEARHFWENWLKNHPKKEPEVNLAKKVILGFDYKDKHTFKHDRYITVMENIVRFHQQNVTNNREIYRDNSRKIWWSVAASLILLVASVFLLNRYLGGNEFIAQPTTYISKQTLAGQKITVTLPDGSKVKINANTQLRYPQNFDEQSRQVMLNGEAYFDVQPDKDRPFVIISGDITTKVLGTSFNVRAYDEEQEIKVAVVEGLVEVQPRFNEAYKVEPENMVVFNKENRELDRRIFNYKKELGWQKGILYFEDMPLKDVFRTLEDWYGVDIKVQNENLIKGVYSGEYENETLRNVLEGIAYTSGFNFSIESNDEVVIKK